MSCKLFLYLVVEREGRLPPILRLRVRLGWVLCQIAPWHCFGEAITSLIGYYKVARKPGSKFIPQNSPTVQFNINRPSTHARPQDGQ